MNDGLKIWITRHPEKKEIAVVVAKSVIEAHPKVKTWSGGGKCTWSSIDIDDTLIVEQKLGVAILRR